jgi:hypothetical protein
MVVPLLLPLPLLLLLPPALAAVLLLLLLHDAATGTNSTFLLVLIKVTKLFSWMHTTMRGRAHGHCYIN